MSNITNEQIKSAISNAIGFEWGQNELQPVNAQELFNIARAVLALQSAAEPAQQDTKLRERFESWWCSKRDLHLDPIGGREFSIAWEAVEEFAAPQSPPAQQAAATDPKALREALQACLDYGAMTGDEWVFEKARAALAANPKEAMA